MLANVLGAYLDSVKEREFDLPLAALLRASSFYDIHFTHGNVEFGKDFIAKCEENGTTIQYSFQSKAGSVSQSVWRNDIMGQMYEAILVGLAHPSFDKHVPHQAVLVITGKMSGNAALGLQELNTKIEQMHGKRGILIWDRETLIPELETYGLGGVHQATASGFLGYGEFYQLYGKSLEHHISQREIEEHSRQWLDNAIEPTRGLLCSVVEAKIFASQCLAKGMIYEAITSYLTIIRTILYQINIENNPGDIEQLLEIYVQAVDSLMETSKQYITDIKSLWDSGGNNLSSVVAGSNSMMAYFIHCARIMEIAGCLYFIEQEQEERDKIISFLVNFLSKEPGCANIPSDYYAISLVLPVLLLCSTGHRDIGIQLLRRATVWLCDRYQDGFGLAGISAEPYEEIITLFGYPFDFIKIQSSRGSFTASVICDLAAYVADAKLYADIVNDIKAAKIFPQYWQVPDSNSLFTIDGQDIITYPNIHYSDVHLPFETFSFADHIKHESHSYGITNHTGPFGPFYMMLLLRDRYFPALWPLLTS